MGYINKTKDGRWGLPVGMIAFILGLVLFGSLAGPAPARAATIACGDCHSIPPKTSDNTCNKNTTKNHPAHSTLDSATCARCHPDAGTIGHPSSTHYNGLVNITSPTISPGLHYNKASSTCTNACHKNQSSATWGGGLDCNMCHYRNGATGGYTMTGLHVDTAAPRTYKHFSSMIVVDNTGSATELAGNYKPVSCNDCHPPVLEQYTTTHLAHIKTTDFASRGNMSQAFSNVTVAAKIGYIKGATQGTGTCAKSCHYNGPSGINGGDAFGSYTIYFKAGQKKRFGAYSTGRWSGSDLKCNECHSTPGQTATLGTAPTLQALYTTASSKNANQRHKNHMFRYKMNPFNFSNQDRNIYCDDCHTTPDINAVRGFRNHSTYGQSGLGKISLPVRSQNARVGTRQVGGVSYLSWRNPKGRDGVNFASFSTAAVSCQNIYCHTIMRKASWTEDVCNKCHGKLDGVDIGSGAPGFYNTTAFGASAYEDYPGGGGSHYSHVMKRGYPCRTCHNGGGDTVLQHYINAPLNADGTRQVLRSNLIVGVDKGYWFNNQSSSYNWATRSCNNVRCHFGSSQNWDCFPYH